MNIENNLEEKLNKLIDDEKEFEFFREIIKKYMPSNPNYVKDILDDLMFFSIDNNLDKITAWTSYYLGHYFISILEYDQALQSITMASEIFERIGFKIGLIYICNGLTNLYYEIGQFKLANEWGLKGIALCEETGEKDIYIVLYMNIGISYIQMKEFERAKEIFYNIEIMDYKFTDSQNIIFKLSLAEIEINICEPYSALKYLNDILKFEKREEFIDLIGEAYKLKGMLYTKLGQYDIAENEFIKSYECFNLNNLVYQRSYATLEWSKLNFLIGRYDKAIEMLTEIINLAKYKNLNFLLREAHNELYKVYKRLNNIEKSLYHLEEYVSVDDKMYDYEQNQLMAKMNVVHSKRKAELYKVLYDKNKVLSTIGQKIISKLDINSIIEVSGKEINDLIELDVFGIAFYNKDNNEGIYYYYGNNSEKNEIETFDVDEKTSFTAYSIKNKEVILIRNRDDGVRKYNINIDKRFVDRPFNSLIYVPLVIEDDVIGAITIQSYKENQFDENALDTIKVIANYVAIATYNALSYKRVEEIATYDNMTGFLVKFEILKLGKEIYNNCKSENKKFSIIMIDIDNFKVINDTYGHVNGDKAISLITASIAKCIRNTDYIGRYGGDEFLLICPEAGLDEAVNIAERIRATISKQSYMLGEGIIVNITISLGVYEFDNDELSFLEGLEVADSRLLKAKRESKNVVYY